MQGSFWGAPYWVAIAATGQVVAALVAAWAARAAQRLAGILSERRLVLKSGLPG